jgi:hypothetical protein
MVGWPASMALELGVDDQHFVFTFKYRVREKVLL